MRLSRANSIWRGARRHRQVLDEPVVERPVGLELERAQRVGDALDGVGLAVREVVGRVDAPRVAGARVRRVHDAVQDRVAQVDVRRGHVDPGAQHARAVRELARAHPLEQVEVLVRRSGRATGSPGPARSACRDSRGSRRPTGRRRRRCRRGSARPPSHRAARSSPTRSRGGRPSRSPSQRTSAWIASMYSCSSLTGFVSSKRRLQRPPNSRRDAEVEADRLGVADVQVAVRLRREAGDDRRRPAGREVGGDDVADEVGQGVRNPKVSF